MVKPVHTPYNFVAGGTKRNKGQNKYNLVNHKKIKVKKAE
jgi:hypothetical protein